MSLPTGTVTFLFTEIEDSTRLWEENPDVMREVIARHDTLLKQAVSDNRGFVFKTTGSGIVAVFTLAPDALAATLAGQKALLDELWPEQMSIRSRMGLHTGVGELRDSDYFGPPLNRCARMMAAGHGGQALLSLTTQELVKGSLPAGVSLIALGEHRLRDLARPETIFQLVYADLPRDFPPLKTLSSIAFPNNLPQQVTSFIGRETVLQGVQESLAKSGLLTLTGAGGSGKSRLALQAAAELLESYPDGVWLVELAPLADANLVTSTTANVLGIKEEPNKPILTTLAESLRAKKLLLILDNCEHVLDTSASLADTLLQRCANVQILADKPRRIGNRWGDNLPRTLALSSQSYASSDPGELYSM
ncbi:MAG: adenylate/guanylate cyclase domain-containing protein [Armatimonas sp.]